jgi:hypothetical protein
MPKTKLEEANILVNTMRTKPERDYGFAYLNWMRNGCVGHEPTRGRLTKGSAWNVRHAIMRVLGDNPLLEVSA